MENDKSDFELPFEVCLLWVFKEHHILDLGLNDATNSMSLIVTCLLSVEPNFYSMNLLMLGKTYKALSNQKMALLYLTRARDYPVRTPDDKQVGRRHHLVHIDIIAIKLLTALETKWKHKITPDWGDFMFSVRFRRRVHVRNDFCFSRRNRSS